MKKLLNIIEDISIHISNFLKMLIVGLFILFILRVESFQSTYLDADWCSEEISTMRNQLSDLWFYNQLDKVDIISE